MIGGYVVADQAGGASEKLRLLDVAGRVRLRIAAAVAMGEPLELHLKPPSPAGPVRTLSLEPDPRAGERAAQFVRERAALSPRAALVIKLQGKGQ